jgi:hypothetical protein
MLTSSFGQGEHASDFGYLFAVLDSIGKDAKSESLGTHDSFLTARAVGRDTRKLGNLDEPSAIIFAFDFHVEVTHADIVQRQTVARTSRRVGLRRAGRRARLYSSTGSVFAGTRIRIDGG